MDLDIILWIGGMLFSLGIFAVKVGFGLGFSRASYKVITVILAMYLVLFVIVAILSDKLLQALEPILRQGPYLHAFMAAGMILWGIFILRRQMAENRTQTKLKLKIQNYKINNTELSTLNSLPLLIPCPVCLTAMTFSTWSALNVIKLPSALVGLGLGIVFILLSLGIYFLLKIVTHHPSIITQKIGLGLSMIGIGLYFIASLFLPAKLEEAKRVYQSLVAENSTMDINQAISVFALLFVALIVGYLMNKNREAKR